MQNSDPVLSVLNDISKTLKGMDKKLEKLDKLDEIANNTREIKKNTGLIYQVALTTKAEITEKSLLGAFLIHLRELGYKGARVVDADLYQQGKEDYVIEAEVEAEDGSRKVLFSVEITNYLDAGEVLRKKIEKLSKRAEAKGSIPVLAARFMSREAIEEALEMGTRVFTYSPEEDAFKLL